LRQLPSTSLRELFQTLPPSKSPYITIIMCFSIINAVGGNVKGNVKSDVNVKSTTPHAFYIGVNSAPLGRTSPPRRGIKDKGMAVGGVNTVEIAVKTGEIGRILGKKGVQAPIVGRCF